MYGALLCGVPARIGPLGTINPPHQSHWADGFYHVAKWVRAYEMQNDGRPTILLEGVAWRLLLSLSSKLKLMDF